MFENVTFYQVCGLHKQAGELGWKSELSNVLHLFFAKVRWILSSLLFTLFVCLLQLFTVQLFVTITCMLASCQVYNICF